MLYVLVTAFLHYDSSGDTYVTDLICSISLNTVLLQCTAFISSINILLTDLKGHT